MSYIQLTRDRRVIAGPGPLPKAWRNIAGFGRLSDAELASHGWYPWEEVRPPHVDPRVRKVVSTIEVVDGIARPHHAVVALTDDERYHLLAEGRRAKRAALAEVRWRRETGGITFGRIPLHTDRESQATLILSAMQGEGERWKGSDGRWYAMDAETLASASRAIKTYKRACFAHEEALAGEINDAKRIEDLDDIDLEAGWPSTSV